MSARITEVGANSLTDGKSLRIWPHMKAITHLKRAATRPNKSRQYAAEEYTIQGDFMKNVRQKSHITSEAGGVVSMSISYAGNVVPLLTFKTKYSRSGLLQTQVKRNGASAVLEHAFAARVFGPIGVFERVGEKRFPVEQKFGPSTAHMMQNEQAVERMDETIRETLDRRLEHEITRVLNGWGGGS